MSNTLCQQCYFAKPANSENACTFDIPNLINKYHTIELVNDYYKLINYNCRYGLSNKIYQENIDKFNNVDLIEYVKQQNIVKYSLAIIANHDTSNIINLLSALSIKPSYITVICCHNSPNDLHPRLLKQQPYIPYKVHNFLENIPAPQGLHIALETNKTKIGSLLWILTQSSLEKCVEQDSIQQINYLINVEQRPAHYYKSNHIQSCFDGIFINTDNYWALSRTTDYTIEQNNETLVINYD
jgi:hypothetical protein